MKSTDKLSSLRRQTTTKTGETQMNTLQPLNEIGNEPEGKPNFQRKYTDSVNKSFVSLSEGLKKLRELCVDDSNEEDEFCDGFEQICDICQIKSIVGNCSKCGLYQYGDNYEILLRRRQ